jgi:hypothetical protein
MAELEIHQESEHEADPTGKKVGVLAALLAVGLAIVTIASHRTHTAAIMHKSSSNDAWQHYQSTRVKYHSLELGETLVKTLGPKSQAADKMLADYAAQKQKYDEQSRQIQEQAQAAAEAAEAAEHRALRYDLGEGFLEIGLVLSSLYFIARKIMFPAMGLAAGVIGIAIAITGLVS